MPKSAVKGCFLPSRSCHGIAEIRVDPSFICWEKAAFTALFAYNDISAIGSIWAFKEAGLRIPEDVSVIGFDDIPGAAYAIPALSTVRQPLNSNGQIAAQTVVDQIEGARRIYAGNRDRAGICRESFYDGSPAQTRACKLIESVESVTQRHAFMAWNRSPLTELRSWMAFIVFSRL